jgi:hypothetical protein
VSYLPHSPESGPSKFSTATGSPQKDDLARADGDGETPADKEGDADGDADAEGFTGASRGPPDGITVGAELPRAAYPDTGPWAEPHAAAATNTKAKAPRRRT